jgi:hypothetical protein
MVLNVDAHILRCSQCSASPGDRVCAAEDDTSAPAGERRSLQQRLPSGRRHGATTLKRKESDQRCDDALGILDALARRPRGSRRLQAAARNGM